MPPQKFNVGLIQMSTTSDPDKNLQHAIDKIHQASARGAHIVCLPELFQTQYFCQREDSSLFDLAQPIPEPGHEPTGRAGEAAADRTDRLGVREARARRLSQHGRRLRQSTDLCAGSIARCTFPMTRSTTRSITSRPATSVTALSTPRRTHRHAGLLGPVVSRRSALDRLQGAEILFYPTAIGWHPSEKAEFGQSQHDAWRTIQRAHAIANGVYVAVVNRVGHETGDIRGNAAPGEGLEFWGGSFLCDPFGRVIAEASHDKEEVLVGEVDLRTVEEVRRNWPFLRDRRIDSYAQITKQADRLNNRHHEPCGDGSSTRPGRARLAKPLLLCSSS